MVYLKVAFLVRPAPFVAIAVSLWVPRAVLKPLILHLKILDWASLDVHFTLLFFGRAPLV